MYIIVYVQIPLNNTGENKWYAVKKKNVRQSNARTVRYSRLFLMTILWVFDYTWDLHITYNKQITSWKVTLNGIFALVN